MDFASSTRAAEGKTMWKGIVVKTLEANSTLLELTLIDNAAKIK